MYKNHSNNLRFELKLGGGGWGGLSDSPVPPVVGALGIFVIIDIVISHQQIFSLQLVFVVVCHMGADSKAEGRKGSENGSVNRVTH